MEIKIYDFIFLAVLIVIALILKFRKPKRKKEKWII